MYLREEVYAKTLEYFNGDSLATDVWINKYCLKNNAGELMELSPDQMHRRIASEFAKVEAKYPDPLSEEEIYDLIKNFKYIIPQGSPMAGIGNEFQVTSLGNCFVIGNDADSYGGIIKTEEEMVHLMKRRGGVGIDLSHIRPKGSPVNNAAISSTGVVPFMERYSNGTREVAQDGRRGALMLSIDIRHKDVTDFIDAKLDLKKVTGANISVKITDLFINAVLDNREFTQQFPINSNNPLVTSTINAKSLWSKLVHNTWRSAEPGILFWDRIISESPADCYAEFGFTSHSTNPCGEIPMNQDSCRLMAINLYSYVTDPFTGRAKFDFELFKTHAELAQRLMDDLCDLEEQKINKILAKLHADPEPMNIKRTEIELWENIKRTLLAGRRTGLGITAEGDMLAALGFRYGTQQATDFAEQVHKTMAIAAFTSSVKMAKSRGSFPIWDYNLEKDNPFLNRVVANCNNEIINLYHSYGRRNIATQTVAPTGSVSILTQTTGGIEPVFNIYYTRRRKINPNDQNARSDFVDAVGDHWEEYRVFHPKFVEWARINGYDNIEHANTNLLNEIIKESPYYRATANDIDWKEKVRMQGLVQKWIEHSIANTINMPESVTEAEVEEVLLAAWRHGCKGVTVYRDNCRSGVLVNDQPANKIDIFKENNAPRRPKSLPCEIMRFANRGEKWVGFLGLLDNRPYEIFTGPAELVAIPNYLTHGEIIKEKNPDGVNVYNLRYVDRDGFVQEFKGLSRTFNPEYWNIGRLVSGLFRHGMPLPNLLQLIDKLVISDSESISSWKNGIKRMIKKYIQDGTKAHGVVCGECGNESVVFVEGCQTCKNCGGSKCG